MGAVASEVVQVCQLHKVVVQSTEIIEAVL